MIQHLVNGFLVFMLQNVQVCLFPLRWLGVFGSPDDPRYYMAGETVPVFLFARVANGPLVFKSDIETYYENGEMIVRPVDEEAWPVMGMYSTWGVFVGAPTRILLEPRKRNRRLVEALAT